MQNIVAGSGEVRLNCLEKVTGSVKILNTAHTESVFLEALREIGDDLVVEDNNNLHTLALPALRTVGDSIIIRNNKLTAVNLWTLESYGKTLLIEQHSHLESVKLPTLRKVGKQGGPVFIVDWLKDDQVSYSGSSLYIESSCVGEISLASLSFVKGDFFVHGLDKLKTLVAAAVEEVTGGVLVFQVSPSSPFLFLLSSSHVFDPKFHSICCLPSLSLHLTCRCDLTEL